MEDMDYHPTQVVRLVEFGQKQKVLKSRAIWMCVGCHACVSQCPNRVHIPALMDTLREMALESGVELPEGRISDFHKMFLEELRKRGRIYELGLGVKYKLRTGTVFKDFMRGVRLICKGRFKVLPQRVRRVSELRKIMGVGNGKG